MIIVVDVLLTLLAVIAVSARSCVLLGRRCRHSMLGR